VIGDPTMRVPLAAPARSRWWIAVFAAIVLGAVALGLLAQRRRVSAA